MKNNCLNVLVSIRIQIILKIGLVYGISLSYLIKGLIYFLIIMCCLDRKYNRKMCIFKKRPIFPHSLLHYKVDIFSFLSLSLISNYSISERFLKSQNLSPQNYSLLHYKVNIFYFLKRGFIKQ